MKLSVDRILNSKTLPIQMFDGYTLCVRNIVNGRVGWSILGFLQEIWIPADCLSLSQLKGYARLHRVRNYKKLPKVIGRSSRKLATAPDLNPGEV